MPTWLTFLATASLGAALLSMIVVVADILLGHRQPMWIMNIVWPVAALYAGPLALWAYFAIGRQPRAETTPARQTRLWQSVGLATSHCGSGCTLGDLLAEAVILPLAPLALFGHEVFAAWLLDYALAFLLGIAFQYFTIAPMRNLSRVHALLAALKADTLSLTAWQLGMVGWMAFVTFVVFTSPANKGGPVFWFMMQIAMLSGFFTSYPVNWWLVRAGIKEPM